MKTKTGVIAVVQEGRFRLVGDDGVAAHFVLGHDAPLAPQDLPALERAQARVAVRFTRSPRVIAGIAHAIEILDPSRSPCSGVAR